MVRLPSLTVNAFETYTQWLHTGRLYTLPTGPSGTMTESTNLVLGYLLGDYLQDVNYKDCLIDAIFEWVQKESKNDVMKFLSTTVKIVHNRTGIQDKLCTLLMDIAVWQAPHVWWEANHDPLSCGFHKLGFCRSVRALQERA